MATPMDRLGPFDFPNEPLPDILVELAQYKPLPYPLRAPEADDYFHTWKMYTRLLLGAAGRWDIVEGQDVRPTVGDGDTPERKEELERRIRLWEKRNHEARFLILQKMASAYLFEFNDCESAKELWDRICAEHRREPNAARAFRIYKRMTERKYRPGTSYVAHVAQYIDDAAVLRELGLEDGEKFASLLTLMSLPADDEVLKIRMPELLEQLFRNSGEDDRIRRRAAEVADVAAQMEIWRSRREEQKPVQKSRRQGGNSRRS